MKAFLIVEDVDVIENVASEIFARYVFLLVFQVPEKTSTTELSVVIETSSDSEGRVSNYKMLITGRTSYPLETSYLYDTANRLTEVRYPAQYGMSGSLRKKVNVTYDQTSRFKDLKYESVTQMDQISYNDYGQATNIRIGGGGSNPLNEEYSFDANTGLMTNQKVKRSSTTLMDLTYSYARGSSKGSINGTTGNLTKIVISTETKIVFMNSTLWDD